MKANDKDGNKRDSEPGLGGRGIISRFNRGRRDAIKAMAINNVMDLGSADCRVLESLDGGI